MTHGEEAAGELGSARKVAESLEIGNIYFESFSAKLKRFAQAHSMELQVGVSYAVRHESVYYRFRVKCTLRDGSNESTAREKTSDEAQESSEPVGKADLATIDIVIVCQCRLLEDAALPPNDVLEQFGDEIIFNAVYPYIREAVSSMIARLGLPALTIGFPLTGQPVPLSAYGRLS